MWAQMSDEELLNRSDLIAMGEWVGQSAVVIPANAGRFELGAIAITVVLKGASGQSLALVQTVAADAPRSSSDLVHLRGQRGLWLLRLLPGGASGIYLADHPQRFVSSDKEATRIAALVRLLGRK